MTPLAQKLQGEFLLPAHKRRITVPKELAGTLVFPTVMSDFKFFDMRKYFARVPMGEESFDPISSFPPSIMREFGALNDKRSELAFFPAEKSWFELTDDFAIFVGRLRDKAFTPAELRAYVTGDGRGTLGDDIEGDCHLAILFVIAHTGDRILLDGVGTVLMREDRSTFYVVGFEETLHRLSRSYGRDHAVKLVDTYGAFLSLSLIGVNSSRYAVSNVVVPGERDRQRSLRGKSLVGKFPLRAYTEITLRPGETVIPEPQHNATTGERAQHFVRAHLRRYKATGKTVLVKEHHRGNPALGMIQHRYRIESP